MEGLNRVPLVMSLLTELYYPVWLMGRKKNVN